MSEETLWLALYLDAPLQSWGYQSRFDRRTTLAYPTRSGVLGMICAAMGIDRQDDQKLTAFNDVKMEVLIFKAQGRLTDFHTVGGGWDKKLNPQCVVKKASNGIGNKHTGTTVVTRREYIQNGRFGILMKGNKELLQSIKEALVNPRWGIWLGRKSCIPAHPIFQGLFATRDQVVERLVCVVQQFVPDAVVLGTVKESESFEDGSDSLMDIPISFASREFAPRRVVVD